MNDDKKCEKCGGPATVKLETHGRSSTASSLSCDNDVEAVKYEMECCIARAEVIMGNQYYPEVNKMGYGPIEIHRL